MFFRDREEVKLKTFDLSQETGLYCIYCFSNLTVHPVASHHGKGPKCMRRRWVWGDNLLKSWIKKKTQLVINVPFFFFPVLSYLILAVEVSSGNAYSLKRVDKEKNKNSIVLSILIVCRS